MISQKSLSASTAASLAHQLALTSLTDPKPGREDAHQDSSADLDVFAFEADGGESILSLPLKNLFLSAAVSSQDKLREILASRIADGQGETIMEIGVTEEGQSMELMLGDFQQCLENIGHVANSLNCDVTLLHQRHTLVLQTSASEIDGPVETGNQSSNGSSDSASAPHVYGHVLIRQRGGKVEQLLEIRVAVVGNVDAGKSTMLGVLTKDVLDDGRGKARLNLFRHKHEIESGRTSSVGMEIMGFDSKGKVLTPASQGKTKLNWDDICTSASKVFSFIDLAGHEKYLKTTVFGMTGCAPDFAMLMIGSNAGVIGMTKEHLGLALALQVPVFIIITKIDMCPANVLENTVQQLTKVLKSSGCRKIPMFINSEEDVLMTASTFISERICPIFQVSNVTGAGLGLLKLFMNVLRANGVGRYDVNQPVEYHIVDTFSVPGVGTVASGTVITGIVHVGDTLLLGPDSSGAFTPTIIKSIHRKRVNVPCASAGQSATFALKKIKRSSIRKGMVLVSKSLEPRAVYEFEAEILVLYHSSTIGAKYQAMLHCGCVRQTARIIGINKTVLRTGDRSLVRFRFMQHPEYIKVGSRLLFREGRTKGVGKVIRLVTEAERLQRLQNEAAPPV